MEQSWLSLYSARSLAPGGNRFRCSGCLRGHRHDPESPEHLLPRPFAEDGTKFRLRALPRRPCLGKAVPSGGGEQIAPLAAILRR